MTDQRNGTHNDFKNTYKIRCTAAVNSLVRNYNKEKP
jgi:hypothetical protein